MAISMPLSEVKFELSLKLSHQPHLVEEFIQSYGRAGSDNSLQCGLGKDKLECG